MYIGTKSTKSHSSSSRLVLLLGFSVWDIVQEHFVQCILCAMPQAGPAVALVAEHRPAKAGFCRPWGAEASSYWQTTVALDGISKWSMKYIRSWHFNQFHRSTAERTSRSRNHCAIHQIRPKLQQNAKVQSVDQSTCIEESWNYAEVLHQSKYQSIYCSMLHACCEKKRQTQRIWSKEIRKATQSMLGYVGIPPGYIFL